MEIIHYPFPEDSCKFGIIYLIYTLAHTYTPPPTHIFAFKQNIFLFLSTCLTSKACHFPCRYNMFSVIASHWSWSIDTNICIYICDWYFLGCCFLWEDFILPSDKLTWTAVESSSIKSGNISGFKCCSFSSCKRKASVSDRPNSRMFLAQNCDLKWERWPLVTL